MRATLSTLLVFLAFYVTNGVEVDLIEAVEVNNSDSQNNIVDAVQFDYKCLVCQWASKAIIMYHKEGRKAKELFTVLSTLCSLLGHQDKQVCQGMINSVGIQLFAILDVANGTIAAKDICGMILGGNCAKKSKRLSGWTLDIPDLDVEPPTLPLVYPKTSNSTYKILHLSDPHVQLDYAVGSSTECGKVICCTSYNPPPKDASKVAGLYGDYKCDLPLPTLDLILAQAKAVHPDIKYVFLTGDYPAHDVWRQDRAHNLEAAKAIVDVVTKHFGHISVYPALGNHEIFPVNMFPAEDPGEHVPKVFDPSWLYNYLAEIYVNWLPGPQRATIKDSGYYSILVKDDLRVISLNTNFCNNFNFWLLLNFNDPHRHLHWMYRQLHKAEVNKERVYILGHIAPGTRSCLGRWSREYNRIVRRFRNTIAGQFFGHTHHDEFQVFFKDDNDTEAISMAYLAPSETSVDGVNPSYRIYEIDERTNLPVNHYTYMMDLVAANKRGQANLTLEYEAKADLGLDDLSPSSWTNYVLRMAKSSGNQDFIKFRQHFFRSGPAGNGDCVGQCKIDLLCSLLTSKSQLAKPPRICSRIKQSVNVDQQRTWWSFLWSE